MRQIQYNNSAFGLRLEWPSDWDAGSITDVTVGVKDTNGTELLAATSMTLWSSVVVQLDGAVTALSNTLTLEPNNPVESVPALTAGDRLLILHSAAGPPEEVVVNAYNSADDSVILERDLRFGHSDHAVVVGLFSTYDLDTSDTDDFSLNKQLVFTWTPDTDDLPFKERGEIVISELGVPEFNERFAHLYPREYDAVMHPEPRLATFINEARLHLGIELSSRGLDINRVVDQELIIPSLMAKTRWLILLDGDDGYDTEREVALGEYQRVFELLCINPIWSDTNQDEVKSEEEYMSHEWYPTDRAL